MKVFRDYIGEFAFWHSMAERLIRGRRREEEQMNGW